MTVYRASDKREYLMIIFLVSSKPYVVTPHLNCLIKTVQMRDHNICFYAELIKIIPNYHQILPLIYSSVYIHKRFFNDFLRAEILDIVSILVSKLLVMKVFSIKYLPYTDYCNKTATHNYQAL